VPDNHSRNLLLVLMLLLPFPGISDTESIGEDFSDSFQRHALNFRKEKDDEEPAEEADCHIEAESPARCPGLHHGEEG